MNIPTVTIDSVQNLFPLSPMQTGMLLHSLTRDEIAYRMQMRLWVRGSLSPAHMEQAWQQIIDRHVIFRSVFALSGAPDPLQVVLKQLPEPFHMPMEDISSLGSIARQEKTDLLAKREFEVHLDPKRPPLMRVLLVRQSELEHCMLVTFHHILMDGWCQGILHHELIEIYTAALAGTRPTLPPVPDYAAYIKWLKNRDLKSSRAYWKEQLETVDEPSPIPGQQTSKGHFELARYPIILPHELSSRLRQIGMNTNASFNAVFQALWGLLIARCTYSGRAVFGMVVSGRPPEVPGINGMVGLFINTVPVIIDVMPDDSFLSLVRRVNGKIADSLPHHYVPTPEILESHPLREQLLSHAIAFENFPERQDPGHPESITLDAVGDFQGYTNFDFLALVDPGETVTVHLKYNRNAIPDDRVKFLADTFLGLARTVADAPDGCVLTMPFISDTERRTLLTSLGAGAKTEYPFSTILEAFHQTVINHPHSEAVLASDGRLTYEKLSQRASQLAHGLLDRKVAGANQPIAILLERDSWMIPSLLGVLMSGSAYLPIDPDYPKERIRFLLKDANCSAVITRLSLFDRLPEDWSGMRCNVEDLATGQPLRAPESNPRPSDMAYIIYTSGSTGTPKGVAVEHAALANFAQGFNDCLALPPEKPGRIAFIANYVFDASGRAIYPPLLRGGTVFVVDAETRVDGARLARLIAAEKLDILDGTPTLCRLLLQTPESARNNLQLRHLICGGEAMPAVFSDEVNAAKIGNPIIYNVYGPTETTIDSTWMRLTHPHEKTGRAAVAIGSPLPNQQIYILSASLNLLPRGSEGELCIGGSGLARGYINQEALTASKFLSLPWDPSIRIYRTGDRARWNHNGEIEYLGRMDQQVKIRGYRIEPGEIEARLNEHSRITSCAVVAKIRDESIGPELIAYYTAPSTDPGETELRHWLSILPTHMIPGTFQRLDALPLTVSGKINRAALPEPDSCGTPAESQSEPAENDREALLIETWSRILGRKTMNRRDNFFDLGGHSLRAAQAAARTGLVFKRDIPPTWIYIAPTPADFARLLQAQHNDAKNIMDTHFTLGAGRSERFFCLPPYGGSGIAYTGLHKSLAKFELVCLNVPPGQESFSKTVAELIQKLEPEKPIHLLGYSGGGNFAFNVAQRLEAMGHEVKDIIMIDCHRRLQTSVVKTETIAKEVDDLLHAPEVAVYMESSSMQKMFRERAIRYAQELYSNADAGIIRADIGLICAEEVFDTEPYTDHHGLVRSRLAWAQCTTGRFLIENARGSHDRILSSPFVEPVARQISSLFLSLNEVRDNTRP